MALVNITNRIVNVVIDTLGAQVQNVVLNGNEYICQNGQNFWSRRAPVLFPIVGRLRDDRDRYNGETYHMPQHGFARDMEFEIVEKEKDRVSFRLTDSEQTKKMFPFSFELYIIYHLLGNNLNVDYKVVNKTGADMYFSIGAHEAYSCPLEPYLSIDDYYLEFNETENLERYCINENGLLAMADLPENPEEFIEGDIYLMDYCSQLPLNEELFRYGTIIFKGQKSERVALESNNSAHGVEVVFRGFPYLGLWKPKDAPFVCIAPWFGIADSDDADGDIVHKEGIMRLEADGVFQCSHTISVW